MEKDSETFASAEAAKHAGKAAAAKARARKEMAKAAVQKAGECLSAMLSVMGMPDMFY